MSDHQQYWETGGATYHAQHKTVAARADFIDRNHDWDNWFLQIETFDPHEPFLSITWPVRFVTQWSFQVSVSKLPCSRPGESSTRWSATSR